MQMTEEWVGEEEDVFVIAPFTYRMDWFSTIGNVNACLIASFIKSLEERRKRFWVPLSRSDIKRGTGLGLHELEQARKKLRDLGLLQEKNDRLNHQMYYRLIGSIGAQM